MIAYYNENEPYAAQWLRNLIDAGYIAPGIVDDRSIRDVAAGDLDGFTQCHFFAGIGIWSHALRFAGWPDDRPVWTGSCPCQPFSSAGKRDGFDDERHLWPIWRDLIAQRRPIAIFGEQVDGRDGAAWLDLVQADLENLHYPSGALFAPAASFGAPHGRHRTYFMAYSLWPGWPERGAIAGDGQIAGSCNAHQLAYANSRRWQQAGRHANGHCKTHGAGARNRLGDDGTNDQSGRLANTYDKHERSAIKHKTREINATWSSETRHPDPTNGHWASADWLKCTDGRWRPVAPGSFPLAHGYPRRVGKLRAYGNAICAPQAIEFIKAAMTLLP